MDSISATDGTMLAGMFFLLDGADMIANSF